MATIIAAIVNKQSTMAGTPTIKRIAIRLRLCLLRSVGACVKRGTGNNVGPWELPLERFNCLMDRPPRRSNPVSGGCSFRNWGGLLGDISNAKNRHGWVQKVTGSPKGRAHGWNVLSTLLSTLHRTSPRNLHKNRVKPAVVTSH